MRFYGNANDDAKIFDVNRDVLEHPDLISAEQEPRLPKAGLLNGAIDSQEISS
jgi:nucleoid-associated protein YgaU